MCSVYVCPRSGQGQGQNLRLNMYDCISSRLYIFWTPGWIYKLLCTNVKNDEMMCCAYDWPMYVQGQGHSLRFNIVWLYLVSALYLLNP